MKSTVWLTAQRHTRFQRLGRYLPESTAHPGKMLPAIARAAIAAYTEPGQLVLDPMCGIGTTLVEAVHLNRQAVGLELEPRWASLANANLEHAHDQGAPGIGRATEGDAAKLGAGLLDEYRGRATLILTSPPYGPSLHGQVKKTALGVEKRDFRYSRNPGNLAHLPQVAGRKRSFDDVLTEILAGCRRILARDGRLVMTVRPYRRNGALVDLPGQLERLAAASGLALHARHAALLCGVDGIRVVPRASFFQIRHQRSGAFPRMLIIAHEDVLVFTPTKRGEGSGKARR